MAFTRKFQSFVCEGDTIDAHVAGFDVIARLVRDDCPDAPDQRQDGFWPSLYTDDPGFIGPGPNRRQRFAEAQREAEAVMAAWRKGEWFYGGIVLVGLAWRHRDRAATAKPLWARSQLSGIGQYLSDSRR